MVGKLRPSRLLRVNDRGQGLAEYIIIVVLVALLILFVLRYFGIGVGKQFSDAKQKLDKVASDSGEHSDSGAGAGAGESGGNPPGEGGGATSGRGSGGSESGSGTVKGAGVADAPGGETDDIGALADSLSQGVGDGSVIAPPIRISFQSLLILLFVAMAFSGYLVARFSQKNRGVKKKKKKKDKGNSISSNESGQAMVEFVLSIITFLFCVLGVIQLAMCLNAYSLVRYAAYNAARAAIVHADDLGKMREAAKLSLLAIYPRHGRADHQLGAVENYLGATATDSASVFPANSFTPRGIIDIRIINRETAPSGTVFTFDDPADAPEALITVQLTHHYELVIPLVNRIAFFLYRRWILSGKTSAWNDDSVDRLAAITDRERRGGSLFDIEYRIPIVAHYTMRMQSDLRVP